MTPLIALALAIVPPHLIGQPPRPAYPAGETRAVRVVLLLQIDSSGVVRDVSVVPPEQPPFDAVAIEAARAMRFVPATLDEKPVSVRVQYAIQFTPPERPRVGVLAGSVRERGTRRKLSGIEIAAGEVTAITDRDGRFELKALPEGGQRVVVAAPGYKRFEVTEPIADGQRLEVAYLLEPLYSSPYEATVTGERARREISKTAVSMAEIERIPGTGGDALKVIEDLPGVARTSPIGGGMLVIRGSNPGDSHVFLDGEPIPMLYHFFALSSTINSDLLSGIELMPGNFGASWGDLTGGVVEVRTRPSRDELHGYANLNLLETSALLEGPIAPGWSFAVAARRSYIDAILGAAMNSSDASFTAAPRYYDGQLRIDWRPQGSAHQLSLLALTSNDKLGMLFKRPISADPNQTGGLDIGAGFSQLRLKHRWQSGALSLETVAMFEAQDNHVNVGSENLAVSGRNWKLRSTGSVELSDDLALSGGIDAAASRYEVNARLPKSMYHLEGDPDMGRPDETPATLSDQRYDRYTPALWAEARWKPLSGVTITPGLRFDEYAITTDRTRGNYTVSPRLTARWDASERVAFKGGIGLYTQSPREGDPLPVFGNPDILPSRALQITAGAEARPLAGTFASVEGFWKKLDDLVSHTGDARNLDNAGAGRVYGVEVMLRKELTERAFGWIAYTLSRSERTDRPGQRTRLFDFDQTHNLTAVMGYKLGRGWQLGARVRLISGTVFTPVIGSAYLAATDSYLAIYGPTNSARAPLFSQIDLRVDKVWTYDAWTLDAYLDVLNATNHRSIEGTAWSYDFSQQASIRGLPIFPSLGLKASF